MAERRHVLTCGWFLLTRKVSDVTKKLWDNSWNSRYFYRYWNWEGGARLKYKLSVFTVQPPCSINPKGNRMFGICWSLYSESTNDLYWQVLQRSLC